ncbi:hypothetical protein TNCV_1431931 [Trichonephila clavipes]|nr:hypothetical protein TNCV_1431931 [Trichonephila clavipes]
MIPAYNKRCAAVPFETGIHFRRKTDFSPEEDTAKSYSGFEPTRLQDEGHSHYTGRGYTCYMQKVNFGDIFGSILVDAHSIFFSDHSSSYNVAHEHLLKI